MLKIPPAPRFRMTDAPLNHAVVQVNFPVVAALEATAGVAGFQAAVTDAYPYMERNIVQQVTMAAGPAGPVTPETSQGVLYEFTDDVGWTLTLTVSSASLSVGAAYRGIDDFADRFSGLCRALHETLGIRRCDRLGVRFLNVVEADDPEGEWVDAFRTEFVGLTSPAITGNSLQASITETRLQESPDASGQADVTQAILRHGIVPSGAVIAGVTPTSIESRSFILDIDAFVPARRPFEPEALAERFRSLHAIIESAFYWSLTDEGKIRFGLTSEG